MMSQNTKMRIQNYSLLLFVEILLSTQFSTIVIPRYTIIPPYVQLIALFGFSLVYCELFIRVSDLYKKRRAVNAV